MNVLFEEDKHKYFKQAVLLMNHRKSERQLLVKDAVLFTIKALLNGAFLHTDLKISAQFTYLREQCPALLKTILSSTERDYTDGQGTQPVSLLATLSHLKLSVSSKFKARYMREHDLLTKISDFTTSFQELMQAAMHDYELHGLN